MMRLLQGDVGSGKTVVALMAMLIAVESGAQAALMAPTEILARQHHATLRRLAAPGRGRDRAADRPREGPGARCDSWPRLASGLTADRRRDPRAAAARCRVSRPRARRDRRAAPLRRRAAPRARRKGPRRRHPADDGDADPAHPDDDRLWRSRRLAADRKAAGTPADRHPHGAARTPRRGHRGGRPRARRRAPRPIGSARWSRNPKTPTSPPPSERSQGAREPCCRAGSAWSTAA